MGSKTAPSTRRRLRTAANKAKDEASAQAKTRKKHVPISDLEEKLANEAAELKAADSIVLPPLPDSDNDEDFSEEIEAAKKSSRKSKVKETAVKDADIEIYVPQGYRLGHQRVCIGPGLDWSSVRDIIFKNVGCENILLKPELQWRFERKNSKTVNLIDEVDWTGLKTGFYKEQKKKEPSDLMIVIDGNYMEAVRARLSGKSLDGTSRGRNNRKKLPDLDLEVQETNEVTAPAVHRKEKSNEEDCYNLLVEKLVACEGCPHSTGAFCLKTETNAHVRFNTLQVKAWAKSWAMGILGVAIDRPPNTPLFEHFYRAPSNAKVEPPKGIDNADKATANIIPISSVEARPSMPAPAPPNPDFQTLAITQLLQVQMHQMQMMQGFQGFFKPSGSSLFTTPLGPPSLTGITATLNNPWGQRDTDAANWDMDFSEFFEQMKNRQPPCGRDLDKIMGQLKAGGIYRTSQLQWFDNKELTGEVGMVLGDVKWLCFEVEKTMQGS